MAALLRGAPGQQLRPSSPASVQTAGFEKQYSQVAPQWIWTTEGTNPCAFAFVSGKPETP